MARGRGLSARDYRDTSAAVLTDPRDKFMGTASGDQLLIATHRIKGAVGPEAGEWIGQLTLAIRARIRIEVLLDTIQPYPTFSEAIFNALRALEERL
jgi:pyruvate/2-oxoglutarate dehydrogenase complex dihydrolipoamide dehydrogenase (E3) component